MSFFASLTNTGITTANAATTTVVAAARAISVIGTGVEFGAVHVEAALARTKKTLALEEKAEDLLALKTAAANVADKLEQLENRFAGRPRAQEILVDVIAKLSAT
jgi:D-arabinose 1-dehydrogenase-like Zn-dependent alcohol dehydrogenase